MVDFDTNYQMLINGDLKRATSTFEVFNPATGAVIAEAPDAGRDDLDQAVAAARTAFPVWKAKSADERQEFIDRFADKLEEHAESFKRLLTKEQGKPSADAEWEIGGTIAWTREIAKQRLEDREIEKNEQHHVKVRHVPLGVVGAITPWNFPVLLAIWKIIPALTAGNTVVLKPSPYTPLCTLKFSELAESVFPKGVLNIVSGGDDLGRWMTSHPDIDKISFTGSTATGKAVMQSASDTLKRVTLELGGNDPAIVLPDIDPEDLAPKLFWAAFQNNAQFCVAAKRVYVHADVFDALSEALVEYAKTVKVGDGSQQGTLLGPIQNKMQFEKVSDLISHTREEGAEFLLGGETPTSDSGFFVPVTIVANPPDDSRVVVEEAFGPVLPLLKWTDDNDVVKRANETQYGLAASVWGKDLERAEKIANQIEAGTVWINEVHQFAPNIPFGGFKESGIGLENALEGLAEYTNSQTIMIAN